MQVEIFDSYFILLSVVSGFYTAAAASYLLHRVTHFAWRPSTGVVLSLRMENSKQFIDDNCTITQ